MPLIYKDELGDSLERPNIIFKMVLAEPRPGPDSPQLVLTNLVGALCAVIARRDIRLITKMTDEYDGFYYVLINAFDKADDAAVRRAREGILANWAGFLYNATPIIALKSSQNITGLGIVKANIEIV